MITVNLNYGIIKHYSVHDLPRLVHLLLSGVRRHLVRLKINLDILQSFLVGFLIVTVTLSLKLVHFHVLIGLLEVMFGVLVAAQTSDQRCSSDVLHGAHPGIHPVLLVNTNICKLILHDYALPVVVHHVDGGDRWWIQSSL